MKFDPACTKCPRLAAHLSTVRQQYPDYYAAPVPAFGVKKPELLIVGLAPGMHGANATGRPFTGDHAGIMLYQTLHDSGFSSRPVSVSAQDKLKLKRCRITNAVKCLPPENKPTTAEIKTCNAYLKSELEALSNPLVILALGKIAHDAILRALQYKLSEMPFRHGAAYSIEQGKWLLDSYHCSRYNTQTRRLTQKMFSDVFCQVRELLEQGS